MKEEEGRGSLTDMAIYLRRFRVGQPLAAGQGKSQGRRICRKHDLYLFGVYWVLAEVGGKWQHRAGQLVAGEEAGQTLRSLYGNSNECFGRVQPDYNKRPTCMGALASATCLSFDLLERGGGWIRVI